MKNHANPFGRSKSMPLTQQQNEDQEGGGRARFNFTRGVEGVSIFEAQENFRNQNARVWSPNGQRDGFLNPLMPMSGVQYSFIGVSNRSPPSSKIKEKSRDDVKGISSSKTPKLASPEAKATLVPIVPGWKKKMMEILADSPVFRPQGQTSINAFADPSPSQFRSAQEQKPPFRRSPLGANGNGNYNSNSHGYSTSEGSIDIEGAEKDLPKQRLPGLGHSSPVTDKTSTPKDLDVPSGNLHHRRHSGRLSSFPNIPSPLGPQHHTDHLGVDVSGLISSLPNTPTKGKRQGTEPRDPTQIFGLHTRQPMPNGGSEPVRKSQPFEFVQGRKYTDPFVEPADMWYPPITASPFVTQAKQKFQFPSPSPGVQVPSTPMFYQFESLLGSPEPCDPMTPSREFGNQHSTSPTVQPYLSSISQTPSFESYQSTVPRTPSFQPFNANLPPRTDLPIPPPPLSCVQTHLHSIHGPNDPSRLDAQALVRGDWIRTEAKKIADLGRLSFAAAQRFRQTGSADDYDTWQHLAAAYEDATNLEKRQEERRNMFMSRDVRAMKTGVDNVEGDGSAAYANAREAGKNGEKGEGKLLGFQMAYMERVCAEVKRREDEKEDKEDKEGGISMEMLETLSLTEKKALRKHLLQRLESTTAGSRAGVLSESFI